MEKFLEAAAIAWNPIGEVRRRMGSGTMTVGSVLPTFLGIAVACNLFAFGAQMFFYETLFAGLGAGVPDHLLLNDYAQRLLSAIGVLAPVAAVCLLPSRVFYPRSRGAAAAAILVVGGAWAFYGAAIGVPVYFLSALLAAVEPALGMSAYLLLGIPIAIVMLGLILFFWLRIMLSVLQLSVAHVIGISLAAFIAEALVMGFFAFVFIA